MPFMPPSAAGECTRRRAGGELLPGGSRGFAKGGTGHPDLRPGFLYPLLRLPLTFRSAAQRSFAAKARGTQLRPLYYFWAHCRRLGLASRVFPRISVRGSGAKGNNRLSGTVRVVLLKRLCETEDRVRSRASPAF